MTRSPDESYHDRIHNSLEASDWIALTPHMAASCDIEKADAMLLLSQCVLASDWIECSKPELRTISTWI
jgi:hypothetical protein